MKTGHIRQLSLLLISLSLSNYAYSAPANPELVSPVGTIDTPTPQFVWRDQSDASRFRLYVLDRSIQEQVLLQYYDRSDVCDGTLCRVTPAISLGFSEKHKWSVKAYNDDGGSKWVRMYFNYVEQPPSPPDIVTTLAPDGAIATATPAFEWLAESDAAFYQLNIQDTIAGSTLHDATYDAPENCNAGLCEVTPTDLVLPENNSLTFRVRAGNAEGSGDWSVARSFYFESEIANAAPVANNDSATLAAGDQVTIPVLENDTDDGSLDPATIEIDTQPVSGTATPQADGSIVYVHIDNAAITDTFTYTVKDNEGATSNVATVTITIDSQPGPDLELTDLNLVWAGYPLIADDVGNRLFVSLGDAFNSTSTISGTISYTSLPAGYGLRIDGTDVISGNQLTANVRHGDKLPVSVYSNNQLIQSYDLVVTNLPLFEVWAAAIVDEPKLPGAWRWADGQAGIDTDVQNLGIEFRGGTSQEFDKKSFGFETRELEFPDESDNVRFFDLRNDDDWIADAAYRDLSLVRNLVSHDIYRDMRNFAYVDTDGVAKGQATIAGGVAEMILNGGYHGLYIISERVDRKLLDLAKIDVPEDAAGIELWDQVDFTNPDNGTLLYKADTNNAGFYNPESVTSDFELKYPDPDDLVRFDPLVDLVNFVNYSDNATFAAEIGNLVDLESLADFWILRLVTSNRDTFKKNYYIGRNKSQKWFFVPWDFDATFGLRWTGEKDSYSDRYINPGTHQIPGRLVELGVTGFTSLVKNRWLALRSNLLTPSAIASRFAGYFNQMGVDQTGLNESARNRNLQRWPGSGNLSSGMFEVGEAAFIEQWLTRRLANVDAYINNLPGAVQ